jgi:hypothetical protein
MQVLLGIIEGRVEFDLLQAIHVCVGGLQCIDTTALIRGTAYLAGLAVRRARGLALVLARSG